MKGNPNFIGITKSLTNFIGFMQCHNTHNKLTIYELILSSKEPSPCSHSSNIGSL